MSPFDPVAELPAALENNQIVVYYQPVFDAPTMKPCGYEALARWHHPREGLITPSRFIPDLERTGDVYTLDIYVAESVCRQLAEDLKESNDLLPVSINICPSDLTQDDVCEKIASIMKRYGIPPHLIAIEITEASFVRTDVESSAIQKFHECGIRVWMDDFGSGYSSLNALKDYDFDGLKLDMNFIQNLSMKAKNIVSSIIIMANRIGMDTLAEGVETEEQSRFLKTVGCQRLQGYLFAKPSPQKITTQSTT